MVVDNNDGHRGFGALLGELAEGSATLVRSEVKLARMEMTGVVSGIGRGAAAIAFGGVLALLGALSLISGLILLAGDQWLPHDLYWLAALIVMAITGGLAAWLAKRGLAQLSPSQLTPNQTVTTLKEDTEWVKQRLTSGATSS